MRSGSLGGAFVPHKLTCVRAEGGGHAASIGVVTVAHGRGVGQGHADHAILRVAGVGRRCETATVSGTVAAWIVGIAHQAGRVLRGQQPIEGVIGVVGAESVVGLAQVVAGGVIGETGLVEGALP